MAKKTDKPWGRELLWAHTENYAGKLLFIKAGEKLSLQYHKEKAESILVMSGRIKLHWYRDAETVPTIEVKLPGDSFDIPPGMKHRFEAIDNACLVEVSTPQLDDVVRIEDDYGRT